MKFGVNVANFGEYADARLLADLARDAESSGWDGFFVWDHIAWTGEEAMVDPWVALAAIATSTRRIRIGPMVAALPRRRPAKLAREAVSLDHLSEGRLILGVGLGFHDREEFEDLGESSDLRARAGALDESLDVITGLWRGERFSFAGKHFTVNEALFLPEPVQRPRIPIWVAGTWPIKAPFRRAARWDGVFPRTVDAAGNGLTLEQIREMVRFIGAVRGESVHARSGPYEVVRAGCTTGDDREADARVIRDSAAAGVTWWHEFTRGLSVPQTRERIRRGPPAP